MTHRQFDPAGVKSIFSGYLEGGVVMGGCACVGCEFSGLKQFYVLRDGSIIRRVAVAVR